MLSVGESKHDSFCVHIPHDEPVSGCFDMLACSGSTKLELDTPDNFDVPVVIGDGERPRDDMIEVNHGSDDDVGPFGVGELRCMQRGEDRRFGEFEVFGIRAKEVKSLLEVVR